MCAGEGQFTEKEENKHYIESNLSVCSRFVAFEVHINAHESNRTEEIKRLFDMRSSGGCGMEGVAPTVCATQASDAASSLRAS